MTKKLAVEVICKARNGHCHALVGRLWWTPEPEPLRFNTSSITVYLLPRDVDQWKEITSVSMGCVAHDGNKGQKRPDMHELLAAPYRKYLGSGKTQTVPLPR